MKTRFLKIPIIEPTESMARIEFYILSIVFLLLGPTLALIQPFFKEPPLWDSLVCFLIGTLFMAFILKKSHEKGKYKKQGSISFQEEYIFVMHNGTPQKIAKKNIDRIHFKQGHYLQEKSKENPKMTHDGLDDFIEIERNGEKLFYQILVKSDKERELLEKLKLNFVNN